MVFMVNIEGITREHKLTLEKLGIEMILWVGYID